MLFDVDSIIGPVDAIKNVCLGALWNTNTIIHDNNNELIGMWLVADRHYSIIASGTAYGISQEVI
jgi:hypothetical protein